MGQNPDQKWARIVISLWRQMRSIFDRNPVSKNLETKKVTWQKYGFCIEITNKWSENGSAELGFLAGQEPDSWQPMWVGGRPAGSKNGKLAGPDPFRAIWWGFWTVPRHFQNLGFFPQLRQNIETWDFGCPRRFNMDFQKRVQNHQNIQLENPTCYTEG